MNLFRLLVLGALIWFVYRVLKNWRIALVRRGGTAPGSREHYEPMAPCRNCGVYLPSAALDTRGRCRSCAHVS
jgi:hypothetical protein